MTPIPCPPGWENAWELVGQWDAPWQGWFTFEPNYRDEMTAKQRRLAEYAAIHSAAIWSCKLWMSQIIATSRGHAKTCTRPACRRKRACIGRRPYVWWRYFYSTMPPCIALDEQGQPMEGEHEACWPLYDLVIEHGWREAQARAPGLGRL